MSISIILVDDQELVRTGFRMVLEAQPDMTVVGEASDGRQAVSLVAAVHPDVVLMDIRMPHLDGIEATRQITSAGQGTAVLVLTTFDDEEYVLGAVRAGITRIIVPKDNEPDLTDLPKEVRDKIEVHLVSELGEVLALTLRGATFREGRLLFGDEKNPRDVMPLSTGFRH